ncbi:MAG: nitroreductase family protein [Erysipelotrichaceae bacterium]|nr:nitroreductase family protein [Erysipelotrichaceae bacterium]
MDVREALQKRRSIRKFTDQKVSDEDIELLLHAGMSGPSAVNRKPWKFYVITNAEKLEALKDSSRFTKITAPLAIVVCGNLSKALPFGMAEYWIHDCSAATENILLQATELGLGSVWCGVYPQKGAVKRVTEVLKLSKKEVPLNIIYIGHPDQFPEARDQYDEDDIVYVK